jgi:hypothetical protein
MGPKNKLFALFSGCSWHQIDQAFIWLLQKFSGSREKKLKIVKSSVKSLSIMMLIKKMSVLEGGKRGVVRPLHS